jgi:hypothetical protein
MLALPKASESAPFDPGKVVEAPPPPPPAPPPLAVEVTIAAALIVPAIEHVPVAKAIKAPMGTF